jgi:hypothetical protein
MQKAVEQARKMIQQLGELEDEYAIAAFLEAEGVDGNRSNPTTCVLARFLMRITGTIPVYVHPITTTIAGIKITNPGPVVLFVARFDLGSFPKLETFYYRRARTTLAPEVAAELELLPPGQIIKVSGAMMVYLQPWLTGMAKPKVETVGLSKAPSRNLAGKGHFVLAG